MSHPTKPRLMRDICIRTHLTFAKFPTSPWFSMQRTSWAVVAGKTKGGEQDYWRYRTLQLITSRLRSKWRGIPRSRQIRWEYKTSYRDHAASRTSTDHTTYARVIRILFFYCITKVNILSSNIDWVWKIVVSRTLTEAYCRISRQHCSSFSDVWESARLTL